MLGSHTRTTIHPFRRVVLTSSDDDDAPAASSHPAVDTSSTRHYLRGTPERTKYQPRRTSTLTYQHSGSQDLRDGSYSRSPRNVVVVIPPHDLPLDRGPLGNVLSVGPRHRLFQGILMPLFPSMFGQLNAIAREYNFPSIVGLCLYLHINENGITRTPRISDDSWQYLFGHLFDNRPYSGEQQLPIGGSIEFDIDLNKARWFDAWISGNLRESNPIFPQAVTSLASLEAHRRGASQILNVDEHPVEDLWNVSGSHTMVTQSRPEALRHLPKKLSLVDRLESHSAHIPPKSPGEPNHLAPSPTHGTYASSPILQSADPQVTESDLERRVNSWRAATELCPPSMAETYQPVPDVAVPTSFPHMNEYALEHNVRQGIRVDEFLWSITSAGPPTPAPLIASSRPSSIHLDRRVNGTVPLTPTTMTSWGPADDGHSIASSVARLPSPDIGERMVEDVMVPRSRAVWGNSFGWRSAVTWKQVYPYALSQEKPAIRVHLQNLAPHYPTLVIYPSMASHPDIQAPPSSRTTLNSPSKSVWASSSGWQNAVARRKALPHTKVTQSAVPIQLRGGLESKYPNLVIYPAVYPYMEIYPVCTVGEDVLQPVSVMLSEQSSLLAYYPSLVIYPAVYPHLNIYPRVVEGLKTDVEWWRDTSTYSISGVSLYPNVVICPAVYPYFDLYPKVLQLSEPLGQKELNVRLVKAGCLTADYPDMTVYPGAYPYLEIYPARHTRQASAAAWGISFGWVIAKTWLQVYPLHTAAPLTTRRHIGDQRKYISTSGSGGTGSVHRCHAANIEVRKQAVWGTSFGWKIASTWRAVWPTSHVQSLLNVSPILGPQDSSPSNYPHLTIYPSAYPHFDIYPSRTVIKTIEEFQPTKEIQPAIGPIVHYPNLVIYPAAYPHFDLYPAYAATVESGKGPSDLHRRATTRRANTAAQVELVNLLTSNHTRKVEEPLQLHPTDYVWSRTSAGPRTSPLKSLDSSTIPRSVHIDRRVHEQSTFISEYPHLVIYLPAYPYFELYPALDNVPIFENDVAGALSNSNIYPSLDIYPAVYPYFNIYPAIDSQIKNSDSVVSKVWHERVEVKLTFMYPNIIIYHAQYPYNLDHIYPSAGATKSSLEVSRGYPWLVVYPSVYPFVVLHPGLSTEISQPSKPGEPPMFFSPTKWESVDVKLPSQYPLLDIYPPGYPWSLESVYPTVSIDDNPEAFKPHYPCIWIYPPVYPFIQPYPSISDSVHIPGALDEAAYDSIKASFALSKPKPIISGSEVYPYFDLFTSPGLAPQQVQDAYVGDLTAPPPYPHTTTQRRRKTHMELRAAVLRYLEKQPARRSKTHLELHTEIFQDGTVWTPSGNNQDISPLITKKLQDIPVAEPQLPSPSQDITIPRLPRSRSGTATAPTSERTHFPLVQPPALPPLRVRSPGIPSQPALAVSETPAPRLPSPTSTYAHMRTTSARFSQAVKSMMPRGHGSRRNSSGTPTSPPPEDRRDRAKSPTRFLSLADRKTAAASSHIHTPEFLTRVPRNAQPKESFVLQRARAYEQAAAASQSSGVAGANGTHAPFVLSPLPSMTGMAEAIEKSKIVFP